MSAPAEHYALCRTCHDWHRRRVWCVAPGCRWAGYRSNRLHSSDYTVRGDVVVSDADLCADRCPRCQQRSVRLYRPKRQPQHDQLPAMPQHQDDGLRPVNGRRIVARRRRARERARRVG